MTGLIFLAVYFAPLLIAAFIDFFTNRLIPVEKVLIFFNCILILTPISFFIYSEIKSLKFRIRYSGNYQYLINLDERQQKLLHVVIDTMEKRFTPQMEYKIIVTELTIDSNTETHQFSNYNWGQPYEVKDKYSHKIPFVSNSKIFPDGKIIETLNKPIKLSDTSSEAYNKFYQFYILRNFLPDSIK